MSGIDSESRLTAAEERIVELEKELSATRRILTAKEREIQDIYLSRSWALLSRLGRWKRRYADPLLRMFGLKWPKRRPPRPLPARPSIAGLPAIAEPPAALFARSGAHDIVCLSIIEWDFRFQRPQQLMSRYAAAGHRVFYVSQQFHHDGPPWSIAEKAPNVYEVTLRGPDLDVYRESLDGAARDLLFDALDALRRDVALAATAVFVQLPFWWPLAGKARQRFGWPVIYDCMDDHSGFSTARRKMPAGEEELLAEADLVVVSSAALEQVARKKTGRVLLLRNACDYEHFANTPPTPRGERPVIGYYGAIADWFDSTLVARLARRRPDWDFVLVGSTYDADLFPLVGLPNVSLPGEQAYETIPDWLARFDVAIIPFRRIPLTEATNPVKVYEMLAGGKPVVSVPIPEVAALAPMVRLASDAAGFEREIEAALAEHSDEAIARRQAFARQNTWQKRYEELERATAATLNPSV